MKLTFLNAKEVKNLKKQIEEQWGIVFTTDKAFAQTTRERIQLISRDIEKIDTTKIFLDNVGMYFCDIKNEELRLSIEGTQLIGKCATKNVVDLTQEEMRFWLKGNDIPKQTNCKGFVIMKHKNDFLGCGKIKGDGIMNFVAKTRRILSSD